MAHTPKPSGKKKKKLLDKGRRLHHRRVQYREKRPRILIVCEGEQTEPNYFRRFRVNADICVVGGEGSPLRVVDRARQLQAEARKERAAYKEVWVVFDKDEFPAVNFNNAIREAEQAGFGVAYSNQAFELWYVLHFDYMDNAISRQQYSAILTARLGQEYRKNDVRLYDLLLDRQPTAIRNARRLLDTYQPEHNPARDDPCTTVHRLVERLNHYVPQ